MIRDERDKPRMNFIGKGQGDKKKKRSKPNENFFKVGKTNRIITCKFELKEFIVGSFGTFSLKAKLCIPESLILLRG